MASELSLFFGNFLRSASRTSRASVLCPPARTLCTETTSTDDKTPPNGDAIDGEQSPAEAPSDGQDPSVDPFSPRTSKAPAYGKLTGTGRNTLKSDILLFFDGLNITSEDIKVDYNRAYNPTSMLVRFPSRPALDSTSRLISRKGRLYRLDVIDSSQWDLTESYNGKAVVLQGIPQNAVYEDIERFLYGCNFDASNMKIFLRSFPDPCKVAVVQFPSKSEAMHACRIKNHSFCLNSPVQMHVLQ